MSNIRKYEDRKGNSTAHLYRDVATEIFYAVIRVGRKIEKKSLETNEYLEALRVLPAALIELGQAPENRKKNASAKLCSDYWLELKTHKTADEIRESTLQKMDTVWAHKIEPYLGNWRADEITSGMGANFMIWHRKRFPGQQLFNTYKYLSNLLNFMLEQGAITPQQMPALKISKKEKDHHASKKGRVITEEERAALRSGGSNRLRLIVGLCDILGMRKMEVGSLQKSRIKKEEGRFMIYLTGDDTKTGLARVLGVPRSLEAALEAQIKASAKSEYLFPTVSGLKPVPSQVIDREWIILKREAKIEGRLRFHDLRHSRATEFARQKVNPAIACTILGMSLRMYQKVYLNLKGSDLLEAIDSVIGASL